MQVELREWRLEDAGAVAKMMDNKNVQNNLRDGMPSPYTAADGERFIKLMISPGNAKNYARAIVAGGRVVGSIGAVRQDNIHRRTSEMGYCLDEDYWGMGIAIRAVQLACEEIFSATDILRIFAEPFAENTASCRVLEKAGFVLEGVLRSNAVKNGRVLDMKMYSKLK